MEFKDRLKELREREGFTQKELSAKLNITQSNVSKYESGKLDVSSDELKRIAIFFNVTVDYLLGNKTPTVINLNNSNVKTEDSPQKIAEDIIEIGKRLGVLEVKTLDSILDGSYSLANLREALTALEQAVQEKTKKSGD